MKETLQEKRESADELINEVLLNIKPEKKQRILDFLIGFELGAESTPRQTA